jgi:hypothetical protein
MGARDLRAVLVHVWFMYGSWFMELTMMCHLHVVSAGNGAQLRRRNG